MNMGTITMSFISNWLILRPKDYQQLSLFEDVEEVKDQEALDKAVDKIRERGLLVGIKNK